MLQISSIVWTYFSRTEDAYNNVSKLLLVPTHWYSNPSCWAIKSTVCLLKSARTKQTKTKEQPGSMCCRYHQTPYGSDRLDCSSPFGLSGHSEGLFFPQYWYTTNLYLKGFHTSKVNQIWSYCPNCAPSSKMNNVSGFVGQARTLWARWGLSIFVHYQCILSTHLLTLYRFFFVVFFHIGFTMMLAQIKKLLYGLWGKNNRPKGDAQGKKTSNLAWKNILGFT